MQGTIDDDTADVIVYETHGGAFLVAQPPYQIEPWGTGRFTTRDCDHLDFELDADEISAEIPLARLTGVCFEVPE